MSDGYRDIDLYIDGTWWRGNAAPMQVENPATGESIGRLACADPTEVDAALAAAQRGFAAWREVAPFDRSKILRAAAAELRTRFGEIARIVTLETGKPLAQASHECMSAADIFDWCAEEGRRSYGRLIPARQLDVAQAVTRHPVGPVAAFTPWNFPLAQVARKLAAALAAGCSVVLKPSEEAPGAAAAILRALDVAGLPAGVVNMVNGAPAPISEQLIASPVIRKVSFTGSTTVGRQIASLTGQHLKRVTLELGGHAPVLVFNDADVPRAAALLAAAKFRNAGQICISPTRFLIQDGIYDSFARHFIEHSSAIRTGNGLDPDVDMGPLINIRRAEAVAELIEEARSQGATLLAGGRRIGNSGAFHEPTVLGAVPPTARISNEEPFGPVALLSRFSHEEEAIAEANRLPYGLAAYGYTRSHARIARLHQQVETGMLSVNHHGLGPIEMPFGGIKESGHGLEGGSEVLDAYLTHRLVTSWTGE